MSHGKERAEKVCLNCQTGLYGRYCHKCGQENIEPRETFWGLVAHFFNDITHFDGKFFTTVKHLVTRPGYLPLMYIQGKRATYLNPVRMYVFTSALFFFIFFLIYNPKKVEIGDIAETEAQAQARRDSIRNELTNQIPSDSLQGPAKDIIEKSLQNASKNKKNDTIISIKKSKNLEQYLAEQDSLPESERDGWIRRKLNERFFQVGDQYEKYPKETAMAVVDKFLHTFPYILFLSLPLFALFLKLLYFRKWYFTDHIMFLIYLYIFTFLVFILMMAFLELREVTGWGIFGWMVFFLILGGIYYVLKGMRTFYKEDRASTIGKFLLFNFMCSVLIFALFILFLIISILMV